MLRLTNCFIQSRNSEKQGNKIHARRRKIGSSGSNCRMTQQTVKNQFGTRQGCYLLHQLEDGCWSHWHQDGLVALKWKFYDGLMLVVIIEQ